MLYKMFSLSIELKELSTIKIQLLKMGIWSRIYLSRLPPL